MKYLFFQIAVVSLFLLSSAKAQTSAIKTQAEQKMDVDSVQRIPAGENSWLSGSASGKEDSRIITKNGIRNWDDPATAITTYIRINAAGELKLGFNLKAPEKGTKLKISLAGQSREIQINNTDFKDIIVGRFRIKEKGYQQITIEATGNNKGTIADINEILVSGPATEAGVDFVKDNFHFGRRGPSVHLRYPIPETSKKTHYFYNEIEVPEGGDVIGSYFMANGFAHGYFGMQVNSERERRILFSVWSPFDTQNPDEIPEDQRIQLLKKGMDVYSGEFGNEGSGGQSFKKFMWKAGTTYKFLLKGEPSDDSHTDYTAYFYAPEKGEWQLIASFRRPKSGNYLGSLYSFLENFVPETGNITRKAIYKNQWVYDNNQKWIALKDAQFTADATANQKDRMDYAGGETESGYFLKNCGFFDEYTPVNTFFHRKVQGSAPVINFEALPSK